MKTRSVRSIAIVLAAVLLLLCSCVTKRPYGEEQYFQGLGVDGDFVVTVNADLLDVHDYVDTDDSGVSYVTDRMTRLSFALRDKNPSSEVIQPGYDGYDFYGAVEGDYSKTLIQGGLKLGSSFTSVKDSGTQLTVFTDPVSGIQAAIPMNGIILFSSTDVLDTYKETFSATRTRYISDEDAARLASSQVGIYVSKPTTMLDLGLDIDKDALGNIDSVLLVMDDETVSIEFRLKSEKLADSFSILIKGGYVGNLRRNGIKPDMDKLRQMFVQELDKVRVQGMELTEEQKKSITDIITSLLDIL